MAASGKLLVFCVVRNDAPIYETNLVDPKVVRCLAQTARGAVSLVSAHRLLAGRLALQPVRAARVPRHGGRGALLNTVSVRAPPPPGRTRAHRSPLPPPAPSFLRVVDRFNDNYVSAYATQGGVVMLLLHDNKPEEAVRHFFQDMHEVVLKVGSRVESRMSPVVNTVSALSRRW